MSSVDGINPVFMCVKMSVSYGENVKGHQLSMSSLKSQGGPQVHPHLPVDMCVSVTRHQQTMHDIVSARLNNLHHGYLTFECRTL